MKQKNFFAGILLLAFLCTSAVASAQIVGGTMKVGSRGSNVSALQQFLSTNRDIYPAGLVTGRYGPLTREAVKQFQLQYGLAPDGIAGPATIAKMNAVMAAGRGIDIYVPQLSNVRVNASGRNATVTFNSNEPVRAYLYYDTNALTGYDGPTSFTMPTVSGSAASNTTFGTTSSVSASSLNANSTYNYMVLAVDQSGNWNVYAPGTFHSGS